MVGDEREVAIPGPQKKLDGEYSPERTPLSSGTKRPSQLDDFVPESLSRSPKNCSRPGISPW